MKCEGRASAWLGRGVGRPRVGGDGKLRAGGELDAMRLIRSTTIDQISARTHAEATIAAGATHADPWGRS